MRQEPITPRLPTRVLGMVLALLVSALLACAVDDTLPNAGTIFSDSAGVQLVQNLDPGFTWAELREDLRIGVVDGAEEYQFFRVRSVGLHHRGEIVVADAGSSTIRIYSADGAFQRKFGGVGGGPGEFEQLLSAHPTGDTIVAMGAPPRYSLFDYDGTFRVIWPWYRAEGYRVAPLGRIGETWMAVVGHPVDAPALIPGQLWMDTVWVHPFDPSDGSFGEAIVGAPGPTRIVQGRGEVAAGPLFDPLPRIAATLDGLIYRTAGDDYQIDIFDEEGSLVRRITRAYERRLITPEWLEDFESRVRAFYREHASGPSSEDEMERLISQRVGLIRVEHLPPTDRLLVGFGGVVWVERKDLDTEPGIREFEKSFGRDSTDPIDTVWDIFGSRGEYVATVRVPESFTPHAVAGNLVLGVLRDELDVEYVVRFVVEVGAS